MFGVAGSSFEATQSPTFSHAIKASDTACINVMSSSLPRRSYCALNGSCRLVCRPIERNWATGLYRTRGLGLIVIQESDFHWARPGGITTGQLRIIRTNLLRCAGPTSSGSNHSCCCCSVRVAAHPARKAGGEQRIVKIEMIFVVMDVACQLSLSLGQAQRKRMQQMCSATRGLRCGT